MHLRLEMRNEDTSGLDNAFKTGDEADWAVYGASTSDYEGT